MRPCATLTLPAQSGRVHRLSGASAKSGYGSHLHQGRCVMATLTKLRKLTAEERAELERLARSRTEEARLVTRAKIVLGLAAGERPYQVADRVGVGRMAAYEWLHRFNAEGLKGLTDHPRPGRPHTYPPERRAEVGAAALTRPEALGLPFAAWTLDRLQACLFEHKGIGIKRTRIDEILIAEGLRWRKQETWFGQKVDPESAAKSDCVPSQAEIGSGSTTDARHGWPDWMMALAVTSSFRATAVRITLARFPRAVSRALNTRMAGLCTTAD